MWAAEVVGVQGALSSRSALGEHGQDGLDCFRCYRTPLFLQDCLWRHSGSGHPDPDFRLLCVSSARPSPTARKSAGTDSTTISDTPVCGPSAPVGTAAAR